MNKRKLRNRVRKITEQVKQIRLIQLLIVIGIIVLIAVSIFALVRNYMTYTSYKVISTLSREDSTSVYYEITSTGMMRYSKNGVTMTNKKGETEWLQPYDMSSPSLVSNGSYMAIGDIGGNMICIFNEYGQIGTVSTDIAIQSIKISRQGVVVAVLSNTDSTYINLYDCQGNRLSEIKASFENTGYPLAVGISPDATKLVISYLGIEKNLVKTKVIFYDFGNETQDDVIETLSLDGVHAKVEFLNNTRVSIYNEDGFALYDFKDTVSEVRSISFAEQISSVFCENRRMGFIFKNQDSKGKYRMEIYDISGKKNTTAYFDFDYKNITSDADEIILYNSNAVRTYRYSGKCKFYSEFDEAISGVMPSWQDGFYWLISDQELKEIRIR